VFRVQEDGSSRVRTVHRNLLLPFKAGTETPGTGVTFEGVSQETVESEYFFDFASDPPIPLDGSSDSADEIAVQFDYDGDTNCSPEDKSEQPTIRRSKRTRTKPQMLGTWTD